MAAVGGFVLRPGSVLLVQRRAAPNPGRWSVPGGVVEARETVSEAVVREVVEECGVVVRAGRVFGVSDLIEPDRRERVRFHYVLFDLECEYLRGEVAAGSDATAAAWISLPRLAAYDVAEPVLTAIRRLAART